MICFEFGGGYGFGGFGIRGFSVVYIDFDTSASTDEDLFRCKFESFQKATETLHSCTLP
jgi:hypothetical protein